jgi:hypothetical protein
MGNNLGRDNAIPERYPYEVTVRALLNMHRFMEFLEELFKYVVPSLFDPSH